jgi:beta-lactamase class A
MRPSRRAVAAALPALLAARPALSAAPLPALDDYERQTGGHVGVFARNLRTGATLAWRADARFVMCSTFKASAAAATLARIDRGQERLDAVVRFGPADLLDYAPVAKAGLGKGGLTVAELCKGAVELSDNSCANLLLARLGGPAGLTAFWRAHDDAVSRLEHYEPLLNRSPPGDPHDTTTPRAMAGNVERYLLGDVLTPGSRDRLTGWMVDCQTGAKRLRAGLPAAWRIADKTGNNGKDAAGDIAMAWPRPGTAIVIAVYTRGGQPGDAQLDAVFAAIGKAVGERLA